MIYTVALPFHASSQAKRTAELRVGIEAKLKWLHEVLDTQFKRWPNLALEVNEIGFRQDVWEPKDAKPYIWILVRTNIELPKRWKVEDMAGVWDAVVSEADQSTAQLLFDEAILPVITEDTTGFKLDTPNIVVEAKGTNYTEGLSLLKIKVTIPVKNPVSL